MKKRVFCSTNTLILLPYLSFALIFLSLGFALREHSQEIPPLEPCIIAQVQAAPPSWRKPAQATVHFSANNPASFRPMLTWTKVKGAVIYEIEFLPTQLPVLDSNELSAESLFSSRQIYVNAYNPDLTNFAGGKLIYWRVRALDFDGNPMSSFSSPEPVYLDASVPPVNAPVPTSFYGETNGSTLLYPVYSWLPLHGAAKYEVEVLNAPPENPNGTEPSIHRIWSAVTALSDRYDDSPRLSSQPFYWRVRGLDDNGEPVGVYSDAGSFIVNPDAGYEVATFGDSISHGGGHMSYSPTDWEYSYQTYLDFPVINLSTSGDTSEISVERFDEDVLPFQPHYLIILEGTNSIRAGVPAEDVIKDLKTLETKCLKNNIEPIFLTLPPINPDSIEKVFNEPTSPGWRDEMDLVNDYIRTRTHIDLARGINFPDGILPERLALDGLHPDINVKRKMATIINAEWSVVMEAIRQKRT